ncbi:MAG TPA: hypothetical protein VEO54_29555 [Thermoanaerobaculia bacterium]|nr:hypothetical protein [Thermoanaerobaculia bacterium]
MAAIHVEKGQTYTLGQGDSTASIANFCFTPPLLDQICVSFSYNPDQPTQVQVCVSYGPDQDCFSVDFSDLACIPIGLDDLGLEICFDNWSVQSTQVCFNVTFKICAFACITVYSAGPICIPTSSLADYKANKLSADDAARLRKILEIQRRVLSSHGGKQGCSCQ